MTILAVGVAGVIGALLRYYMGQWVQGWGVGAFPLGTLLINLLGCFGLAWFSCKAAAAVRMPAWFRVGFGTGLIGSFTTFSTFSVDTVKLLEAHMPAMAAIYVGFSLIGGLAMAAFGRQVASATANAGSQAVNSQTVNSEKANFGTMGSGTANSQAVDSQAVSSEKVNLGTMGSGSTAQSERGGRG